MADFRSRMSGGEDPRGRSGGGGGFSAKGLLKNSTAALLKAGDIGAANKCDLHVYGIRPNTAKEIFAVVLLDIEPINGKGVFPLNITNIQRISELIGDDISEVVGKVLTVGRFDYGDGMVGLQVLAINEPATEGAKGKGK